ncbi:SpoIIE family protein phosphatase [Candidatus Riflebacteria bacterium]
MKKTQSSQRVSPLHHVSVALHSINDLRELLNYILEIVTKVMEADRSAFFLLDHEKNELYSMIAQDSTIPEIRVKLGQGIAGMVAKTGEIINIPDTSKSTDFHSKIDRKTGYQTKSILCAPMYGREGKILAVIQVLNKKGGPFTHEDEERLVFFCEMAGIAIENASLYESLRKSNLELRQSRHQLKLRLREESLLLKLEKTLSHAPSFTELWKRLLKITLKMLGAPSGHILLRSDNIFKNRGSINSEKGDEIAARLTQLSQENNTHFRNAEPLGFSFNVNKLFQPGDHNWLDVNGLLLPLIVEEKLYLIAILHQFQDMETVKHYIKLLELIGLNADTTIQKMLLTEKEKKMDLENKAHETELKIAARIHSSLLQKELPVFHKLEFAAFSQPAKEIGGDYFDFLKLDDEHLFFIVADVAGKGIQASLIMSSFRASLRAELRNCRNLEELALSLNQTLCNDLPSESYLTLFMGIFDFSKRELTYLNAGQTQPYLLRNDDKKGIFLVEGNMPAGIFEEAEFKKSSLSIQAGDLLFCYTDGVNEALNEKEECYGEKKLQNCLKSSFSLSPDKIKDMVLRDIKKFSGTAPQSDDTTLLIIKFNF